MERRFGWPGLADTPWSWPFDPTAFPGPAPSGSSPPVSPPPAPNGRKQDTVARTTDLSKQGNLHTQVVALILNSLIRRGELTEVLDKDVTKRWAMNPTASPLWPGSGLTVRASAPGTYGTFT